MELKLIAQVILKLFGFPVWRTHCQITPGGFLPTNKFDFPINIPSYQIVLSEMLTESFSILILPRCTGTKTVNVMVLPRTAWWIL